MNKISLILILTFSFESFGQIEENDRNGFASVNYGLNIPTGNYGSKKFSNSEAGFATKGSVFDIAFGHKILPKLGVMAMSRGLANGFDVGEYAQGLANYLGPSNPMEVTTVGVESNSYSLGGLLTGIYGSFPIANKISFEPRLLAGISGVSLPAMTIDVYESGAKIISFIREHSTTVAFSYNIGAGTVFDVSKKVKLMINVDFFAAKAEWNDVQEISIGHISDETEIYYYDYDQNFGTVNVSTGIGFKF